jgi:hypothetical protein
MSLPVAPGLVSLVAPDFVSLPIELDFMSLPVVPDLVSLPIEPVVGRDPLASLLELGAGVVPLLVSAGLLTSVPVVDGELPELVCANADVASIVPAAVSASTDIHVAFITLRVFIKGLLVLLRLVPTRASAS